jgi:hypothetical protein
MNKDRSDNNIVSQRAIQQAVEKLVACQNTFSTAC